MDEISDRTARRPAKPTALRAVYEGREPQTIVDTKGELYDIAANAIGQVPLTYLEFGVYRGDSMREMRRRFSHAGSRFYGFDSFEGLPEAWGPRPKGTFATDGAPIIPDKRVSFVKGYFQNTVPGVLRERSISGPVLVHFDADLYSSTLFLLTTLWHHIPAYHFIFDEFWSDELRAFRELTDAYPIEYEFIAARLGPLNGMPKQILGTLRNVTFSPV